MVRKKRTKFNGRKIGERSRHVQSFLVLGSDENYVGAGDCKFYGVGGVCAMRGAECENLGHSESCVNYQKFLNGESVEFISQCSDRRGGLDSSVGI